MIPMESEDGKIFQDELDNDQEFKYNFISMPWDDRTSISKAGIVSLLVAIFTATVICVIHNFVMHFGTSRDLRNLNNEMICHLVKLDEYQYVARIHSIDTQELLCVGAVVSKSSVIASGVCVKAGPIRLWLGNPSNPKCKKSFSVDVVDPIYHEGTPSKHLVLLTSSENIAECGQAITVGSSLDYNSQAYIIGRPFRGGRFLTHQPATLVLVENYTGSVLQMMTPRNTICVKDLGRCPVRAGDLLIQGGFLFGLASFTTHVSQAKMCFADLRMLQKLSEPAAQIDGLNSN